ncbi:MAG: glycoside hydrolase family 6 protein [Nocardioidaceae bacterium]
MSQPPAQPSVQPSVQPPVQPSVRSIASSRGVSRDRAGTLVGAGGGRPRLRGTLPGVAGVVGLAVTLGLLLGATPVPHPAVAAAAQPRAVAGNPLAGHRMGVYKGAGDQAWAPYQRSRGTERRLLAKIALRPKAKWFGGWIPNREIGSKVDKYIAASTGGDSDVLVQMTFFRMRPWEHEACRRLPSAAEQASYKQWVDRAAAAIGNARVALILQPDGPFALCAPGGSTLPSRLIAYSTRRFSTLPRTSVYIDGGASDWPSKDPAKASTILLRAGVRYARGFALNSTHYSGTSDNIDFGTQVVAHLARKGVPNRHFVINTSSNGRPFTFNQARGSHPDNAKVCATRTETRCVTLGIPPTTNVTSPAWHLSAARRARAKAHVDAYLWFGRPWLFMQADPFVKSRALALARTTPF